MLVNCAGIIRRGDEHDAAVFEEVLAINLTGTMRCCTLAREKLKRRGATVARSSTRRRCCRSRAAALVPGYSASKGGVAQLTKSLALAYAADGIRVNAIAPGWVAHAADARRCRTTARAATPSSARTPLGRWAEPEDIAGAAVFLCSPAARFVTGAILPVDGGLSDRIGRQLGGTAMALNTAIRHLQRGDWEKAHAIVQNDDDRSWAAGRTASCTCWKATSGNARYWYRRRIATFPSANATQAAEIAAPGEAPIKERQRGVTRAADPADGWASGPRSPSPPMPDDERVWVPQAQGRVVPSAAAQHGQRRLVQPAARAQRGILSRHRHPMLVVGYVIKGRWKYLEHDWTAEEGSFVYEPPGEIHTLTVPEDCPEMITFFNISGAMIYLDGEGRQTGYEDVLTKIDMCRAHYARCGLGAPFVEQFIR